MSSFSNQFRKMPIVFVLVFLFFSSCETNHTNTEKINLTIYMAKMVEADLQYYEDYYLDNQSSEREKFKNEYNAMRSLLKIKSKLVQQPEISQDSVSYEINKIMLNYCGQLEGSWNYEYYKNDIEYFNLSDVKENERALCNWIKLKNSFKLLYFKSVH